MTESAFALKQEVREFLKSALPKDHRRALGQASRGHNPSFSRALAAKGWVGMSIPKAYGGCGSSAVERFIVTEELLAAGAPVSAHWVADRQSAPAILMHGTADQKRRLLPPIATAEAFWAIGMSEPDSGSDLASVRTKARKVDGGWRVSGQKVWTTWAHLAHYFAVLCRTSEAIESKHDGLSQLIVDLHSEGVTIRTIRGMDGDDEFCEVVLEDVFVPDEMLLGNPGEGWQQVLRELAYERYGPERWMSSWGVFIHAIDYARNSPNSAEAARELGQILAKFRILREMSLAVANSIDSGGRPEVEAAVVKDLGTVLEQDVVEKMRELLGIDLDPSSHDPLVELLTRSVLNAPMFTIRGGTTEVLRSILAGRLRA